jgi:peptide methionine sulfoxide reductase msrA/msrB
MPLNESLNVNRRWLFAMLIILLYLAAHYMPPITSAQTQKKSASMSNTINKDTSLPKTDAQWKKLLPPDEYAVLRQKGTEPAFTGKYWNSKEHGTYRCAGCGQPLFKSDDKFESGTGWPSFWEPYQPESVTNKQDNSHLMHRTEVLCSRCGGHLGHVFDDGPAPTGLRYCINSVALKLDESTVTSADKPTALDPPSKKLEQATFGAGCFWCSEAVFQRLKGVEKVESGYSGGHLKNPTYEQVSTGRTGHAEVIQVTYDPAQISYEQLLEVFWKTHDPTTLNRQGNDAGAQYRSAIFYHNDEQRKLAEKYKEKLNAAHAFNAPIVTEIAAFQEFFPAEDYHQDYYRLHGRLPYCQLIIRPKIDKLEKAFGDKLKAEKREPAL